MWLSDSLGRLQRPGLISTMGTTHRGIDFADDGSHEQNVSCRIAAQRRPVSAQPSEIRMSGSLPITDRFRRYGMAI